MAFLFNVFRSKPVAPARVPTDKIVPVHSLDDSSTNRSFVLNFTMKFDDVLDPEKVSGALEKLLEKPGWRKLGARMRLNADGKLDYHIPAQYTKERPALRYTHVKHDMSISQHPLASQLSAPSDTVQISPELKIFRPVFLPEGAPSKLEDWLYSDLPQLLLHIVSFSDSTVVTLTWPHTLLDALGRRALVQAWSAVLHGRDDDVPEFYGEDTDPLAPLGKPVDPNSAEKEEEFLYKDKIVSGWKMVQFVFNYLWELLVYRAEENHCVIVPAALFKRVRAEALNDLSSMHPATIVMDTSDPANPKPFLSDGDVLCAWWTRLLTSSQPWLASAKPTKTIQIMNVFGMRDLLTNTEPKLLPPGVAYIGNCVTAIFSFFTLHEFLNLPLGVVAARLRSDLVSQSTRPQVEACMRLYHEAVKASGRPPLFGEADMAFSAFSNWTKGRFFEIDFSRAVVGENGVGKPTYIHVDGYANGLSVRNAGPCVGKDRQGNWWIGSTLRTGTWRNLEKAVEGLK